MIMAQIFRYELPIQDFQQLQPIWPGTILSVVAHPRKDADGRELPVAAAPTIDLYAFADEDNRPKLPDDPNKALFADELIPVYGVWIIGTGREIPQECLYVGADFRGTVDFRDVGHGPQGLGAWHVFIARVGSAAQPEDDPIAAQSLDDYAQQMADRHRRRA